MYCIPYVYSVLSLSAVVCLVKVNLTSFPPFSHVFIVQSSNGSEAWQVKKTSVCTIKVSEALLSLHNFYNIPVPATLLTFHFLCSSQSIPLSWCNRRGPCPKSSILQAPGSAVRTCGQHRSSQVPEETAGQGISHLNVRTWYWES